MPLQVNARTTPPPSLRRAPPPPPTPTVEPTARQAEPEASDGPLSVEAVSKQAAELRLLMRMLNRDDADEVAEQVDDLAEDLQAAQSETSSIEIRIERSVSIEIDVQVDVQVTAGPVADAPGGERKDPLVLDLDGDGQIELTSAAQGRAFDIDGDGVVEQTAFVAGGDAFLALDRDGDGRITRGTELFGDHRGARDGFGDLAALDTNRDRVVDARDTRFDELRVFDGERTRSLADAGVEAIELDARYGVRERADGNAEVAQGRFRRSDGRVGRVADVLLAYQRLA